MDPANGSLKTPGLLAVSYGRLRGAGSYDDIEDSVRAYCACWSAEEGLRLRTFLRRFSEFGVTAELNGFVAALPKPRFRDNCGGAVAGDSALMDGASVGLGIVPGVLFDDVSFRPFGGSPSIGVGLVREKNEDV